MVAENFAQSLAKVLEYEGGYSNDAGDPGGATMWGITHIDYDAYRRSKGLRPQDVRKMTREERDDIYRNKYWAKSRCDELPGGIDFVVFDGSVNSGISQSVKWLQRAVSVPADGKIGPQTIDAVDATDDKSQLVDDICDQRLRFLKSLRHWSIFGKGWSRRVKNVRQTGKELTTTAPEARGAGKAIEAADEAEPNDYKPSNIGIAEIAATAGTVAETAGTVTTQAKSVFKSRISGGAVALGASSTATVAAAAPQSIWDQFLDVWKSPFWWLFLINISLVAYIVYHYWRDHGKGALQK